MTISIKSDEHDDTYTDEWHKYLARVFILVIYHCLSNRNLRTGTTAVYIALDSVCYLHRISLRLRALGAGA